MVAPLLKNLHQRLPYKYQPFELSRFHLTNKFTMSSSTSSPYIGVRKRKWGRWVSEIREPGTKTRIWLGSFDTSQMAAAAYDAAACYLKGSEARLNFPELAHTHPRPVRNDPDSIRLAAHQAAMQFGTRHLSEQITVGSTTGSNNLPPRVALSPTHIQAINESPLDSSEMWMQLSHNPAVSYDYLEWEDTESFYSIWD